MTDIFRVDNTINTNPAVNSLINGSNEFVSTATLIGVGVTAASRALVASLWVESGMSERARTLSRRVDTKVNDLLNHPNRLYSGATHAGLMVYGGALCLPMATYETAKEALTDAVVARSSFQSHLASIQAQEEQAPIEIQ